MSICRVILLLSFSLNCVAQTNFKKAYVYGNYIKAEDLKQRLSIIASADMEGRETATAGQRKAAAYIEKVMKETGLLPANNGSYQMKYPVYRDSMVSASLTVNNQPLVWKSDFNAAAGNFNAEQSFSEVIFINQDDS